MYTSVHILSIPCMIFRLFVKELYDFKKHSHYETESWMVAVLKVYMGQITREYVLFKPSSFIYLGISLPDQYIRLWNNQNQGKCHITVLWHNHNNKCNNQIDCILKAKSLQFKVGFKYCFSVLCELYIIMVKIFSLTLSNGDFEQSSRFCPGNIQIFIA